MFETLIVKILSEQTKIPELNIYQHTAQILQALGHEPTEANITHVRDLFTKLLNDKAIHAPYTVFSSMQDEDAEQTVFLYLVAAISSIIERQDRLNRIKIDKIENISFIYCDDLQDAKELCKTDYLVWNGKQIYHNGMYLATSETPQYYIGNLASENLLVKTLYIVGGVSLIGGALWLFTVLNHNN